MTDPFEQQHPDPIGEGTRRQLNNATVIASFAEAIARWRYTKAQERADQDARAAEMAARAAEQEGRDAAIIRRHNAAQQRAAAAVYERAGSDEFLLRASTVSLGETWAAAAAYAADDPRAAGAMRRVEIRLRVLHPEAMAHYDSLRAQGAAPQDAMAQAVRLMDPGPEQQPGPAARPGYGPAGALANGPVPAADLIPAGGPGDVPRAPSTAERLAHLRSLDTFLATVEMAGPADAAAAERITQVRAGLRRDIEYVDAALASAASNGAQWRETPALDRSVGLWVRAQTAMPPADPAAASDPASQFNEVQRRAAGADYSRAFDAGWLQRAGTVELGQAWAAAAAYPGDRRATVALERIEEQLRATQPNAMRLYSKQLELGADRHEAMLRAVPFMEQELASGKLAGTEQPAGRFTGDGITVRAPSPQELPAGRAGEQAMLERLRDLDSHLQQLDGSSLRDQEWRRRLQDARADVLAQMRQVDQPLAGDPDVAAARTPSPYQQLGTVGRDPDADLAERRAGDLRAAAARDQAIPDSPATPAVDEHKTGVDKSRGEAAGADHNAAAARSPRTAAQLAGESFPQAAGTEVAQANKARAASSQPPAAGQKPAPGQASGPRTAPPAPGQRPPAAGR